MKIRPVLLVYLVCMSPFPSPARGAEPANTNHPPALTASVTTAEHLLEEARSRVPSLTALTARTQAAQAEARSVRSWEDPMFRLGTVRASEEMMMMEEGDLIYGIDQPLPLFGRVEAARRTAEAGIKIASAAERLGAANLRLEIHLALLKLASLQRMLVEEESDAAWLRQMARLAESRFSSGDMTLANVLTMQNEATLRETEIESLRGELLRQSIEVNQRLNQPLSNPWPRVNFPSLPARIPTTDVLQAVAARSAPTLELADRQTHRATAQKEQAARERFPKVTLGLEGRSYSGDGSFKEGAVMLGFTLPFFNRAKYREDVRRAEAEAAAMSWELEDLRLQARSRVSSLATEINTIRAQLTRFTDELLPRFDRTLSAHHADWETGRHGSARELIEARRALLQTRLQFIRMESGLHAAIAELLHWCGRADLDSLGLSDAIPDSSTSRN